jgi:hypothetical protein
MDGGVSTLLRVESEFVIINLRKYVAGRGNILRLYFHIIITLPLLDLRYIIGLSLSS